jgi:oligopeptide/dipeptide ABC transporter ATP-binding protein
MTAEHALELHGVAVARAADGVELVHGVDLAVARGSVLGIVGETGAGKTLTMRAVLGLLPRGLVSRGTIALGDRAVDLATPATARRALLGRELALVPQNPAGMLDPVVRVGDQLVEGVLRRRTAPPEEARERARALLARVGFPDPERIVRLYPHQLSGGMSQRVGIAMALMPRPRVLIVDEPTSALDANLRIEILALIRAIARDEGTAVVLVSHDLGLVARFCDAVAVLYAGTVVERGGAEAVIARPRHPYAVALRRVAPRLTAARRQPLATIPGAPPTAGELPPGCPFAPRCELAEPVCRELRPALAGPPEQPAACHVVNRGARARVPRPAGEAHAGRR